MSRTTDSPIRILSAVGKGLVVLVAGYLAFEVLLRFFTTSLFIWPPILSGLVVGMLSAVLFGRKSALIALVLSWMPVAFSWYRRGIRVLVGVEYGEYVHGHLRMTGATKFAPDYGRLAQMLLFALIGSIVGHLLWRLRNTGRRRS